MLRGVLTSLYRMYGPLSLSETQLENIGGEVRPEPGWRECDREPDSQLAGGATADYPREADSLSATYLIRANPLLTYAQKPRTETEEKAYSSERAKEAVR